MLTIVSKTLATMLIAVPMKLAIPFKMSVNPLTIVLTPFTTVLITAVTAEANTMIAADTDANPAPNTIIAAPNAAKPPAAVKRSGPITASAPALRAKAANATARIPKLSAKDTVSKDVNSIKATTNTVMAAAITKKAAAATKALTATGETAMRAVQIAANATPNNTIDADRLPRSIDFINTDSVNNAAAINNNDAVTINMDAAAGIAATAAAAFKDITARINAITPKATSSIPSAVPALPRLHNDNATIAAVNGISDSDTNNIDAAPAIAPAASPRLLNAPIISANSPIATTNIVIAADKVLPPSSPRADKATDNAISDAVSGTNAIATNANDAALAIAPAGSLILLVITPIIVPNKAIAIAKANIDAYI